MVDARRVANEAVNQAGALRCGLVTAVDPANHAVRMTIQPEGEETGWVPCPSVAAGGVLQASIPPEVGDHLVLAAIEGDAEHPVVVGRLYDTTRQPPVSPATGKPAQPGEMLVVAGPAYWHVTNQAVMIGFGSVHVVVNSAGMSVTGGNVVVSQDVAAGAVSLRQHTHSGVQAGSGMTGKPVGG
jgi:phage baseplate assembly protein gpV